MALASAVPLIALPDSAALMMSLPATRLITGATGTPVSTLMLRVPAAPRLPAVSVAVADSVSSPWPIAVISAAVSV